MGDFLTIVGFVGVPVCFIVLIVRAIRKKKVKSVALTMAGLFACFVVGLAIVPSETLDENVPYEAVKQLQTERQATPKDESAQKDAPSKDEILALSDSNSNSYKDLLRTPDDYIDQYMVLTVKLSQVLEGGWLDDNVYYFGYTDNDGYEWYFDDKYCFLDGRIDDGTKLLESDVLRVYGRFVGAKTFTTALIGTDSELPCVEMLYVEILE